MTAPGAAPAAESPWLVRRANFEDEITFAVPGMIGYETGCYANRRDSFVALSVTGNACELACEHCRGRLLASMIPARTPEELLRAADSLRARGCRGILVTGGCDRRGRVPLRGFLDAIARVKESGLSVLAHTGLVAREEAAGLKRAGVDQVLFDVVGDSETIREVCHLDRTPGNYASALGHIRDAGLAVAPHVVVGLHFGRVRGEYAALETIAKIGAERLVLVALKPLPGTPMAKLAPVKPETVGELVAAARVINPKIPISFGCARPYGPERKELERRLVDAGVNALAFPDEETVRYAEERGLRYRFEEACCSLA